MFKGRNIYKSNLFKLMVGTLLLVITSALIGFVALTMVVSSDAVNEDNVALENSTPQSPDGVQPAVRGTPNPLDLVAFRSAALGFEIEYPRAWRKNEHGLQVIFAPSPAGLDPDNWSNTSLRFGIPADNTVDPADLLTQIQAGLRQEGQGITSVQPVSQATAVNLMQPWLSTQISFEHEQLGGTAIAWIATTSKDEVGYYAIAIAPAERWKSFEPAVRNILNSFHFTSEAVLRPTDATPPPTPTPTPTPIIHVVESGDTLLQIALQYGVDVDALAARNDIDDPRRLRTGTRLIIPIRRR